MPEDLFELADDKSGSWLTFASANHLIVKQSYG